MVTNKSLHFFFFLLLMMTSSLCFSKNQEGDIIIEISEMCKDNYQLTLRIDISNNSKSKLKYFKPLMDKEDYRVGINPPWELNIVSEDKNYCLPWITLGYGLPIVTLKSKEQREHVIVIDFAELKDCDLWEPLSRSDLKGVFDITVKYMNWKYDYLIESNTIQVKFD